MTVNDIVEEIYKTNLLTELCENIGVTKNNMDDFLQEIYLILLEYDEEKLIEIYNKNQLKFFMVRIILNQHHSKNSPFYMKYKRYQLKANELTEEIIENNDNNGWTIKETSNND